MRIDELKTYSRLTSQHTGGTIIALTRECQAQIAKQTGTRFAPIDGGPGYDGNGWQRLGYCYKQAPDIDLADDGTGTPGSKRRFDAEYEDFRKSAEQSLRQLRADITRLVELEHLAQTDRVKRLEYQARADDFLRRNGRQWFALAADYLPEMVEGRENNDG